MKRIVQLLPLLLLLASCKKEKHNEEHSHEPAMHYKTIELKAGEMQSQRIDVDDDGVDDLLFAMIHVGDPVLQRDRKQFFAGSRRERSLLNDNDDQSPVLNRLDTIGLKYPGYTWFDVSAIVLSEKIITASGNSWEGRWTNASHKYLPFQIQRGGSLYHGWIELSFSTTEEKIIIHRSGVSKEAGKTVKAGL